MTRDEIKRVWRKALPNGIITDDGMRICEAVAKHAMEEAAQICEERHRPWKWDDEPDSDSGPRDCARSIRAAMSAGDAKGASDASA